MIEGLIYRSERYVREDSRVSRCHLHLKNSLSCICKLGLREELTI